MYVHMYFFAHLWKALSTPFIHLLAPLARHPFTSKLMALYCAVWRANTTKMLIQRRISIIQCLIFNQKTGKDERMRCLAELNFCTVRGKDHSMLDYDDMKNVFKCWFKNILWMERVLDQTPGMSDALHYTRTWPRTHARVRARRAPQLTAVWRGIMQQRLCRAQCCRHCLTLAGWRGLWAKSGTQQ